MGKSLRSEEENTCPDTLTLEVLGWSASHDPAGRALGTRLNARRRLRRAGCHLLTSSPRMWRLELPATASGYGKCEAEKGTSRREDGDPSRAWFELCRCLGHRKR